MKPIEISIRLEISSRPYHPIIMWSNRLGHDLSNALSTIPIRHIEQVEMAFKVAHKKRKIKKIQNSNPKTLKILKNSHFEKKFQFFSIMSITVSPIELRKKFHRLTHICPIRS